MDNSKMIFLRKLVELLFGIGLGYGLNCVVLVGLAVLLFPLVFGGGGRSAFIFEVLYHLVLFVVGVVLPLIGIKFLPKRKLLFVGIMIYSLFFVINAFLNPILIDLGI